ncbi:hypothetical protein BDV97DRAFT_49945 [Delphinella strobiligena]|nr:hypothetical protein BDV97DRAFT_49945 [Delphinella strobiligena]
MPNAEIPLNTSLLYIHYLSKSTFLPGLLHTFFQALDGNENIIKIIVYICTTNHYHHRRYWFRSSLTVAMDTEGRPTSLFATGPGPGSDELFNSTNLDQSHGTDVLPNQATDEFGFSGPAFDAQNYDLQPYDFSQFEADVFSGKLDEIGELGNDQSLLLNPLTSVSQPELSANSTLNAFSTTIPGPSLNNNVDFTATAPGTTFNDNADYTATAPGTTFNDNFDHSYLNAMPQWNPDNIMDMKYSSDFAGAGATDSTIDHNLNHVYPAYTSDKYEPTNTQIDNFDFEYSNAPQIPAATFNDNINGTGCSTIAEEAAPVPNTFANLNYTYPTAVPTGGIPGLACTDDNNYSYSYPTTTPSLNVPDASFNNIPDYTQSTAILAENFSQPSVSDNNGYDFPTNPVGDVLMTGGINPEEESRELPEQEEAEPPAEDEFPDEEQGIVSDDDNEDDNQEESEQHTHHLRPGFRDAGMIFSTWIDKDTSGNYDPHSRAPKRTTRKHRSRDATVEDMDEKKEAAEARQLERRQRRLSEAAARVNDRSWVVTIKLHSDKFKEIVAAGGDNWPDDEWNMLGDPLEEGMNSIGQANVDDEDDDMLGDSRNTGYRLRNRDDTKTSSSNRPDLAGQPAARGCWGCWELGMLDNGELVNNKAGGQGCSLVHDGTNWPCRTCVEDGHSCELITPPNVKQSCESCKTRRLDCSYARTSNHGEACQECKDTGRRCIAGPNKSVMYQRISLGQSMKPQELDVFCVHCRETRQERCSLKHEMNNKTGRPCHHCERSRVSCIVADPEADYPLISEAERPQKRRKTSEQSHRDPKPFQDKIRTSGQQYLEDKRALQEKRSKPQLQPHLNRTFLPRYNILTTKLCHPISFNHDDPTRNLKCHFCSIPSYGTLGLGDRTVTTIDNPKTGFIEEIKGGHRFQGQQTTRICAKHTHDLMKIFTCNLHQLQKIEPRLRIHDGNFKAAFDRLCAGRMRSTDLWCSVCLNAAEYQCCNQSCQFMEKSGCGLLLCYFCRDEMTKKHNNALGAFVESLPMEETGMRPFGIRADAELLKENGQLARFMLRQAK